jgi:hypothetical protein
MSHRQQFSLVKELNVGLVHVRISRIFHELIVFGTQYAPGLVQEGFNPFDPYHSEPVAEPHLEGFTQRQMDRYSSKHVFSLEKFVKCYVRVIAQIYGRVNS